MTQNDQEPSRTLAPMRRGKVLYKTNPSISGGWNGNIVTRPAGRGRSAMIVSPDTGELLGSGTFGFMEEKEIDSERFVKVYLDGIKQYAGLGKAGASLFEFLYRQISGRDSKDKDTVTLNYFIAQEFKPDLTRRTYERGLAELLDKEFLFRTIAQDTYFVNVRFMFNGDRMVLMKSYRRAGSPVQQELNLPRAPSPAPDGE